MTSVSLGALVVARLSRAAITTVWRVEAGEIDQSEGVTPAVDHFLYAWLTIPHRDLARLSEPVGWGRGGRRVALCASACYRPRHQRATRCWMMGGSVKRIKQNLFTIVHKALEMRQLKFRE